MIKNLLPFIILISCLYCHAQETSKEVSLQVEPEIGLFHKPVKIIATGLPPLSIITFSVTATDARKHIWNSSAVFITDSSGTVNLANAISIDGSYLGVHPMGLFWSMKSNDYHQITTWNGFTARIDLKISNQIVASKEIYRQSTQELDELNISLTKKRDSIIADFYLPEAKGKIPAIIFLGGSGGDFRQERSSMFASEGYAVLNLKYFKHEGLPDGIVEIPLEYVEKAHQWLASRPEIDINKIGIMGRSMGSQLAMLYAAYFDGLQFVITEAPSSVVWYGWGKNKSSFTYKGVGFPYAEYTGKDSRRIQKELKRSGQQFHDGPKFLSAFQNQEMTDRAAIPVEKIKCPIMFISGNDDKMWPSTKMAKMMMDRLNEFQFKYEFVHKSYENAGHNFAGGGQGCGIPYLPPEDYSNSWSARGGTDEGNSLAAIQSWDAILKFIESHLND